MIFETATPFDTPRLMEGLVASTNDAFSAGRHHQLLIIGHFVVRFFAIHPYQDGNGRLSRALTTLLLLQAGYSYVPCSSLERIIEESKDHLKRLVEGGRLTRHGRGKGTWYERAP